MSSPNVSLSVLKHIFRWKYSKIKSNEHNTTQQKQTKSECFCLIFISGRENILCTHVTSSYPILICPRRKTEDWWSLRRRWHQIQYAHCIYEEHKKLTLNWKMFCLPEFTQSSHYYFPYHVLQSLKCKLPTANCKLCIQIIVEFQSKILNKTNTFDSIEFIRKFHIIYRVWKMFGIRCSKVFLNEHGYLHMKIEFSIKIFTSE